MHQLKLRRQTIITKCCNPYYKMRNALLLQNAATLQLQNAYDITKCCNPYYKTRKILQNVATLITKRVSYYKMRWLLQNAAEQLGIASIASPLSCLPRFLFRCYSPHRNSDVIRVVLLNLESSTPRLKNKQTNKQTNGAHFKTRCLTARVSSVQLLYNR